MELKISNKFSLPADSITQTFAILAKRRVGKTYTASIIAEEFIKNKLPFVVLDPTGAWWGLQSSKDGKKAGFPVYVIGGDHGIPLEASAGKVIAEQIATHPSFYIIDLSRFESNAAQDRFALDFGEHLYRIKAKHPEPLHVFIDEADAFIPQRPMPGQQRMLGAFEALVRRGGIRGIGITLISQRAAVINKNVLTQTECLILLQTTSPQDQNAIDEWIKRNGTDEERKTLMNSLASLKKGEAWIYSPVWLESFIKVDIRERETFNSSATPKFGDKKINPVLAKVDLEKLSDQIKATMEKAKENDPSSLRKRVRELETELSKKMPEKAAPKINIELLQGANDKIKQLEKMKAALQSELQKQKIHYESIIKKAAGILNQELKTSGHDILSKVEIKFNPGIFETKRREESIDRIISETKTKVNKRLYGSPSPEISLASGARRMLASLIQYYPNGLSEGQMRSHAGLKKSGSFTTYKSALRTSGMMEERSGLFFATQTGIDYLGENIPAPGSCQDVLDIWLPKLPLGAQRMLKEIVSAYPEKISDGELQELTELKNSGSFTTYKSMLKTARLIEIQDRMMIANAETLFL